jgi:type II secretory pathway predicted ATPase ExeA
MYLNYYNLKEKPFELSPGPRFLWLGANHSEALATLKYGILENKGFLLLTGDVGVGKTALIHRLIQEIDPSPIIANIPDPGLDALDFFNMLANEFHMAKKFKSKGEFIIELKQFLQKTQSEQKNVLLIIDEAQRLKEEILEQVRLLSNIEMSDRKLINIFFVGQPEFMEMLMDDRNRAVRQRIVVSAHVESLAAPETERYIHHRLKVAGATRNIFTSDAVREIHRFSAGCPRLINIVCDHALLSGYSAGLKIIDSDVIEDCEQDLRIPAGFALKKIDVQPMPEQRIQPPTQTIEAQPRRSRFRGQFAYASLFCVLSIVVIYVVFKSGLWSTPLSYEKPYSPQQLVEQSNTNRSPAAADEKMTPDATGDKSATPEPPARASRLTQFQQKQDSSTSDRQKDNFEIVDQTMTISSDQSQPAQDASSNGNDLDSGVSLPVDENNDANSRGTMPDAEVTPSLETAFQREDEDAQPKAKELSSDQIMRIIAEMAARQSNASSPVREEGIVASKTTSEDQVPVTNKEPPANVSSEVRPEPTDNVKAIPPVKSPPVQTADLNPPAQSTPSKKPVPEKGASKQPSEKKPDSADDEIARVDVTPSFEEQTAQIRLENRLRMFLQKYCNTYAAKDLAKFTDFFGPGARENGKPFESLLPKYQENFDQIETIQYRIELQQYTYDRQNETVKIEGDFFLKWLPSDNKWRQNSGKIFMNLKDEGQFFLVQRLDYYGDRKTN